MTGIWFGAMVAGLILTGMAAQLGWRFPTSTAVAGARRLWSRHRCGARIVIDDADFPKLL